MSTENEIIEDVEISEESDKWGGGGGTPTPTSTGCIAQVSPTAQTVDVKIASCCDNIIASVNNNINMITKQVKASIIKGKVICNGNSNSNVEGAIVVATGPVTLPIAQQKNYVGITNNLGEYSIVVPTPNSQTATYSVTAYFVSSCSGVDICTPGSCDFKCR